MNQNLKFTVKLFAIFLISCTLSCVATTKAIDIMSPRVSKYRPHLLATCGVFPKNSLAPFITGGSGTGILLDTGYILTSRHVVDIDGNGEVDIYEKYLDVEFYGDVAGIYSGIVVIDGGPDIPGSDDLDFAIVKVVGGPKSNIPAALDTDYDEVLFGDGLFTIGRSDTMVPHITSGKRSTDIYANYHRMSASIFYGNSGGGVFDDRTGKLIGIVARIRTWSGGIVPSWGEYVPITKIREALTEKNLSSLIDGIH